MNKPLIIVLSKDSDTTFNWQSSGWYDMKSKMRNSKKAEALFKKAEREVIAGKNILECIARLKKAGFAIKRGSEKDLAEAVKVFGVVRRGG
jgi:hypothetical protein